MLVLVVCVLVLLVCVLVAGVSAVMRAWRGVRSRRVAAGGRFLHPAARPTCRFRPLAHRAGSDGGGGRGVGARGVAGGRFLRPAPRPTCRFRPLAHRAGSDGRSLRARSVAVGRFWHARGRRALRFRPLARGHALPRARHEVLVAVEVGSTGV